MDADRWLLIETLLEHLSTLNVAGREELIRASCEGDKELEEELRSLFDTRSRIEGFLEEPAIAVAARAMNASGTLALAPHQPGSLVSRYRLLEKLGEGGMGVVYKAEDTRLRRLVALKFLPPEFASDPSARLRFEREARAASALNHPNICTVYDIGEDVAGRSFIAMEYLPGRTLKELVAEETLDVPGLLRLGTEILDALEAAHAAGIVHRDIKPANILITDRGAAKILDFGIARDSRTAFSEGAEIDGGLTRIGVVAGTLCYMSPEQACGLELDGRSDLFSLGVVLYEAATQTDVFRRETPALTCDAILNGSPVPASRIRSDLPSAFDAVIDGALEKDRTRRFQSASEFRAGLETLSRALETSSSAPAPQKQDYRKRNLAYAATIGAGISVAAVFAFLTLRPAPAPLVTGFAALTHDAAAKDAGIAMKGRLGPPSAIAADANRVYFTEDSAGSQILGQVSTSGGEKTNIPVPFGLPVLLDANGNRSQLLVTDFSNKVLPGPLWTIAALTGTLRRVGDLVVTDAAWSPDGNEIVWLNGEELFRSRADGSNTRHIAHLPHTGWRPRWSPDGKRLRITLRDRLSDAPSLWELRSDGTNLHPLLAGWNQPPNECCGSWTPDGRFYVFQSSRNGKSEIWALPEKRRLRDLLERHSEIPIQITSGQMNSVSPTFSPDGKTLYVVGQALRGELNRLDQKSMRFVPWLGGISAQMADFSRDGEWVTYVSFPEGTLWRSRLNGTDRLQLTFSPMYARVPRWSPDGKMIVFHAISPGQRTSIWAISRDGGKMEAASTAPFHGMNPCWLPDSHSIMFSSVPFLNPPRETSGIFIVDLRSHIMRKMAGSEGFFAPDVSPDGRYIAAVSSRSGHTVLFDSQTGSWTELSTMASIKRWSQDSRYVYSLQTGKDPAIDRVRVSDGRTERLVSLNGIRLAGDLAGLSFTLDPNDYPVILRDAGIQEIYSLAWKISGF